MLTIELVFLSCLSFISCQRYYAFVETLFVIDPTYFPHLSSLTYAQYVRTMVDTTNMVFQSNNDLDVKIEVIVSDIVQRNGIAIPSSRQPNAYESSLRDFVSDYDRYDSIVLLWYQPWEGPRGAQGYALMGGLCSPSSKIMYLLPYQNAGFYLAHELGHQFGLEHQLDSACPTTSFMSVMTTAHTVSYEQARWSKCENDFINKHICQFKCLFNQPSGYLPIINKYSTLPGQTMSNEQQAKTISSNEQALGELSSHTYMPSEAASRCLYVQHYTGAGNGEFIYEYTSLLPGSNCGVDSICRLDRCVPRAELDRSSWIPQYDTNILDLTQHCNAGDDPKQLETSNADAHRHECVNMEDDFLCTPSQPCPANSDTSFRGLYMKHICCEKCSKNAPGFVSPGGRTSAHEQSSMFLLVVSISFIV